MFCDRSVRVRVRDGKCVSARGAGRASGQPPCAGRTVPELLAMIRAWVKDDSGSMIEATFDPVLGYPTHWHIQTNIEHEATDSRLERFRAGY